MTTRCPNDPGRVGELVAALTVEERRIELTISKIARAAKNDEIEWLDLDNACGHGASLWSSRKWRSLGEVHPPPGRELTDTRRPSQGQARYAIALSLSSPASSRP